MRLCCNVRQRFLSTPSARRATKSPGFHPRQHLISIHALREEGDAALPMAPCQTRNFYPRPPRGGRPGIGWRFDPPVFISIHALREEGDQHGKYRRGPTLIFLSTPSARRATKRLRHNENRLGDFYPRPPRGGRRGGGCAAVDRQAISIHALREEGDFCCSTPNWCIRHFYPRPPRGGRLSFLKSQNRLLLISIHALREEGDESDL